MKRLTHILIGSALALGLAACTTSGDDGVAGDSSGDSGVAETGSDSMPPVTTSPNPTTITASAGDSSGSDGGPGLDYEFDDTPPDELTQIDRMGMPAINTAVIASKDDYNESTPEDDAAGTFVDEIVASLEFLHGALDDDLMGAGLTPCAVDDCVAQAAPLVVPDVLHIDPSAAPGFPNGRMPADPVIDVTLAVILLDLSEPGQDAAVLAGLPLNPPANDLPFLDEFPFLAAPHE